MDVSDAKRLRAKEQENARLKKLLAETMLDKKALEAALQSLCVFCSVLLEQEVVLVQL